jgi:hypothetical protein
MILFAALWLVPFAGKAQFLYVPGTTGWGSALGGRPTVLWNPTVDLSSFSAGNNFGFTVASSNNIRVVVEAISDLNDASWDRMFTNTTTTGSFSFADSASTNFTRRFYRLRW